MATFSFSGAEDIVDFLTETRQLTGKMAEEMVAEAVPVLVDAWRYEIISHGYVDTGAMLEKVGAAKPKASEAHVYRDVYPLGKDKKGVRNAEKAFLLHYGWGSNAASKDHEGSHFVDKVEEDATQPVVEAMEGVMNGYMERGQ